MPTKVDDIYHCNKCGNRVTIIYSGAGTLVCCGVEMELINF
jgi:desulfoferrodoxin-like iron-binding protein